MAKKKDLVQEIAVFGESGSGKTVLVSSFYGHAREPETQKKTGFKVIADEDKQLHGLYLGMRDDGEAPIRNFASMRSYDMAVSIGASHKPGQKTTWEPVMQLVWHDYPGEWFEKDKLSGPEETQRRIDGFRTLLGSNVALLLIDGQKLADNAGAEKAYLKSVLATYQASLARLKKDILQNGARLTVFPRIWLFALTKADLLPEVTATSFRDLMLAKVHGEIEQLQDEIAGFVATPDALSVGDEFLLTSSAQFTPGEIDVTKRKGLDLILPIAAVLPLEWHKKWRDLGKVPLQAGIALLKTMGLIALLPLVLKFINKLPLPGPIKLIFQATSIIDLLVSLLNAGSAALSKHAQAALQKGQFVVAALLFLGAALDEGEEQGVLVRHS